ncbi:MAG: TIGR02300 family protein [Acidisphaera sp.]|nr:TIGR02300 family protein [Acidisphaera sp.]MBV9813500.1 TIGR02300 family protein [Acetobacteraceae bacterium]
MAKPVLGTKRVCVACSARFYDLFKQPAICPKCGTEQPADQPRPRRTGGNVVEEKRRPKVIPVPGMEDSEIEGAEPAAEEEGEEDVLEDTSDLEGADDAIADVEVEVEGNEEER